MGAMVRRWKKGRCEREERERGAARNRTETGRQVGLAHGVRLG
jgi:hypothetical protein